MLLPTNLLSLRTEASQVSKVSRIPLESDLSAKLMESSTIKQIQFT